MVRELRYWVYERDAGVNGRPRGHFNGLGLRKIAETMGSRDWDDMLEVVCRPLASRLVSAGETTIVNRQAEALRDLAYLLNWLKEIELQT